MRRPLTALAAAALMLVVAGCSSGFDAQTDQIYQPGPGITVRKDGVYLLNAAIVTDGSGNGTLVGALLDTTGTPDTLTAVTLTGKDAPSVSIMRGRVDLPAERAVQLADEGNVRLSGTITAGTFQTIHLTFKNGAPITTQIPVLTRTAEFSKVPIGALPGGVSGSF